MTYTANAQHTVIHFVDDTTGKTLTDLTLTGKTGDEIDTAVSAETLRQYEAAGYEFVAQDLPDQPTFDAQTNSDQQITVHLRHGVKSATQQLMESQTVIYVGAGDDTPKRVEVSVPVSRVVKVDAVTGDELAGSATFTTTTPGVTVDAKTGDVTFATVKTPMDAGYHAKRLSVVGHATPTMDGVSVVKYERDTQRVHVVYVDDDQAGRAVMTGDDLTGLTGDAVAFAPSYVPNYVMTHVDQTGAMTFDKATQVDQTITVHLQHDMAPVDNYVTRQIHYCATNEASVPAAQTKTVVLHGLMDLVTGRIEWSDQKMPAVSTPVKSGYQADIEIVPDVNLAEPTPDWMVDVTYTPAPQQVHVVFVDQATGRELRNVAIAGVTDGDVDFSHTQSMTDSYLAAGYDLVQDTTPVKVTFTTEMPTYQVVLAHRHKQVTQEVTRHVHYETSTGVPAPEMVTQTVTMTGERDLVTGEIVWQPVSVAGVVSPFVPDYTADQLVVRGDVLKTPDMAEVVVCYVPKAKVPLTTPKPAPQPESGVTKVATVQPVATTTSATVVAKSVATDDIKSQKVMLPETGAERDFVMTIAGLLLLSISAGLAIGWFYSEDKQ